MCVGHWSGALRQSSPQKINRFLLLALEDLVCHLQEGNWRPTHLAAFCFRFLLMSVYTHLMFHREKNMLLAANKQTTLSCTFNLKKKSIEWHAVLLYHHIIISAYFISPSLCGRFCKSPLYKKTHS